MVETVTPPEIDQPVRMFIVDDHRSFSEALALVVDLQPDLECVGVAASVEEALRSITPLLPDVVIMDIHLPGLDGIEGTRRVKELLPEAYVLILTAHTSLDVMARAASVGAHGFLPKEASLEQILAAIRTASEGGMLVERSTLSRIMAQVQRAELPSRPPALLLTPREREVLEQMGEGLDPRAIARRLDISPHTARGYVKSILAKLGAHSQLQAVILAVRGGLLPGSQPESMSPNSDTPPKF